MRTGPAAVILLCVASAACGDSKKGTPPPPNQPTPPAGHASGPPPSIPVLEALPVEVELVAGARIGALAEQEVVVRAVNLMFERDPELERRLARVLEICRIDPMRDLDSAVVGLGRGGDRVLMVVSGRLAEPDLARCTSQALAEVGGSLRTLTGPRGHTIYHATGQHEVFFAFLGSGALAIATSQPWLEQALGDRDKAGQHPVLGPLLAQARRDAALWWVGLVPAGVGQGLVAASQGEIAAPPVAYTGNLGFPAGLDAELGLVMTRPEDANAAASKAIPQLILSSLVVQQFALGPTVNKIRVTAEGPTLFLRITLTEAELADTLAGLDLIGSPVAPASTEVDSEGRPLQDSPVRNQ